MFTFAEYFFLHTTNGINTEGNIMDNHNIFRHTYFHRVTHLRITNPWGFPGGPVAKTQHF